MASMKVRNYEGRKRLGQTLNVTSEPDQSDSYQFQFNVDEANGTDNQTTIDAGVTPINDDSQQQQQQNLTPNQLEQLFHRASV